MSERDRLMRAVDCLNRTRNALKDALRELDGCIASLRRKNGNGNENGKRKTSGTK